METRMVMFRRDFHLPFLLLIRRNFRLQITACRNIHRNWSHYDALGLTPKATHADVKKAYYKLSLLHHPDKNPKERGPERFQEISAAYEILGNLKLRRLYDKGMLTGQEGFTDSSGVSTVYEAEPTTTERTPLPKESRFRSRIPRSVQMTGKTATFNFDDWSRHHYGEIFKAQVERTTRHKANIEKQSQLSEEMRIETVMLLGLIFIGIGVFCSTLLLKDWDNPLPVKKKNGQDGDDS